MSRIIWLSNIKRLIQWVPQEDRLGCQIACAAMIVGCSYAFARESITPDWDEKFPPSGYHVQQFIERHGYKVICGKEHFYPARILEETDFPWPPEPFADLHWCSVLTLGNRHYRHSVIMLSDGVVLDPDTPEPRRLADYRHVEQVRAVIPVPGRSSIAFP